MLILPGGQGHDIRTADMPTDDELKPRTSAAAGSTRVAGIVLCGGRSSRMGQPKHLLPFGDETMLQRVVRTLSAVVSPVVVVAARGQQLPELPPETLIAHDDLENPGPLGGIAAGMQAIMAPDLKPPSEEVKALALAVVPSLADVIPLI